MDSHIIDYKIYGDDMQVVAIELDPNDKRSAFITGSSLSASIYFSGSGQMGVGTKNPKSVAIPYELYCSNVEVINFTFDPNTIGILFIFRE